MGLPPRDHAAGRKHGRARPGARHRAAPPPLQVHRRARRHRRAGRRTDRAGGAAGRGQASRGPAAAAPVLRGPCPFDGQGALPAPARDVPGGRRADRGVRSGCRCGSDHAGRSLHGGDGHPPLSDRCRTRRVLPRDHGRGQAARRGEGGGPRSSGRAGLRRTRSTSRGHGLEIGGARAAASIPGAARRAGDP